MKVTLAPIRIRRLANWRVGFMCPCAGKVTRKKCGCGMVATGGGGGGGACGRKDGLVAIIGI